MRISGLLLSFALIGAAFYSAPLVELFRIVLGREESSHGLFVPLLSLYFLWRKRSNLRELEPKHESLAGLVVISGGVSLFSLARAHAYFFWECSSFLVVLSGLLVCFLGKKWLKEILFPLCFLISMIPILEPLYNIIVDWLRQGTISISTQMLALIGVPFLREGLLIHLPNTVVKKNIGCSGVHHLISYFVFGMAYAYLYRMKTS